MATVSIKVEGLDKLKRAFTIMPREVSAEINDGIKKSVIMLEGTAKRLVPVDTGRLRSSHTTHFTNMRGELYPTVKYAVAVHEGTRPHIIMPKNKKALHWKGASNPYRKVRHPGTQNMPWLTATANKESSHVERIMQQSIHNALEKVFG